MRTLSRLSDLSGNWPVCRKATVAESFVISLDPSEIFKTFEVNSHGSQLGTLTKVAVGK